MDINTHLRFWAFVEKTGACWYWQGKRHPSKNYGYFKLANGRSGGRHVIAHRFAYVQTRGPIPADRPHLDHLCSVRSCVNPAHLEPVTCTENNRRSHKRRHRS